MDYRWIIAAGIVFIGLFFVFTNGFHDGCNVLATMISSRAISPRAALLIGGVFEFIGALFLGKGVAKTLSTAIINPQLISIWVIFSCLGAAIIWNLITWGLALPSSSSQALIGGLLGAVVGELIIKKQSIFLIHWNNVLWIIIVLLTSPFIGLSLGYIFTRMAFFFTRGSSPKVNIVFRRLQILSSIFLALSHSSNDAPKTMGIIVMSLIILDFYHLPEGSFIVPGWVSLLCALGIALGVSRGGWRIMKTLGARLYKIRPVHGFGAQSASVFVVGLSSFTGFPVSTTQIVNSSVMGAGAADRPRAVRWGKIRDIFIAWIATIPASGIIALLIYFLIFGFLKRL